MSRHCHVSATSCDATDPHALVTVVSLVVLCEASDVGTEHPSPLQRRARPSRLILFDRRAGGVGITTAAYAHARRLLARPAISCHTLIIQTPTATPTAPRPAIPCRTPANTISIIVRVTVNISEKTNAGEHDESWKKFREIRPENSGSEPDNECGHTGSRWRWSSSRAVLAAAAAPSACGTCGTSPVVI